MIKTILALWGRWQREEDGQTLVEYGLLVSLLALVAVASMILFSRRMSAMWGTNGERYPDPPAG